MGLPLEREHLKQEKGRIGADWNPENEIFWEQEGKVHANRNLWISIPSLVLAFCVWSMWSVIGVKLTGLGFTYTPAQITMLVAIPGLIGATLRIFYTFMPGIFGGRNWTVFSTAILLIPTIGLGTALQNPETSYRTMFILAALCGLGGGNFSSSMANIGYFFPKKVKGSALGMNGGIGNMGVSILQVSVTLGLLSVPFGVGVDGVYIQNIAYVWVIPIAIMAVVAWFGMDNIPGAKQPISSQLEILKKKHSWIMAIIYTCCFGSFIGFGIGFALISQHIFPDSPYVKLAFVGPFIGALTRWIGGSLADRFRGGIVTVYSFIVMIIATCGAVYFTEFNSSFYGFFAVMVLLFAASGIANGSTFQMVPIIFQGKDAKLASPVTGFIAAIAAYGSFFIPKVFGWSFETFQTGSIAFYISILYYIFSLGLTYFYYVRKNAEIKC